ncbi:orotidine-5'-phosphate decarboxylase [Geoalkalibacter halelectricus]|uniref:Orotidine 5'-phosphate decarboxylase n=1 Tax=Geoalkalibacter halelectricus TaxID=2847045 RepID=A0ABY5ZJF4_9BACT|nr:orotidine-5'-phosphate decarboxylase [Geoalkalibacter halelectricus]
MMLEEARKKLIFALDVDSLEEARRWVALLHAKVGLFKVGKQLFTRCGPEVVHMIRSEGGEVFLDLKYHDIPNTVAMASVEALRLGVRMCNVHALGGREMMAAAATKVREEAAAAGLPVPLLLAVTILTSSTDDTLREIGIERPVREMVPHLARLARDAGMGGVVASPQEIALIRAACGADFAIVTPGVRPAEASVDDQKRIMTPAAAIAAGADYLVIGRPIARASDPAAAADAIVAEMAAALAAV